MIKKIHNQTNILRPDRIRQIKGSFAFIEHRFLRGGFFESLNFHERLLYFFLVMISDKHGISWYTYDRICSVTGLTTEQYIEARNSLVSKDLLDFDGRTFQVLSLPEKPVIKNRNDEQIQELSQINNLVKNLFGRIQ